MGSGTFSTSRSFTNFEPTGATQNFTVAITLNDDDGGVDSDVSPVLTINAVNDNAPVFTADGTQSFTIAENSNNGTIVGSAAAIDADVPADTLSYSIFSGDPNNGFAIDSNGQITIADASMLDLDYDNGALVANLVIEVSDGANTTQQSIEVSVSPVNDEVPLFTAGAAQTLTIAENSGNGTVVGSTAATDADVPADTLNYEIVLGDPNDGFAIDSNGQITIADASVLDLDFENGALVATLTVEASDGTNTTQQTVTVNVSAVNDNNPIFTAGAAQALTIAENSGNGTVVGSAAATDADVPADALTYQILVGNPNNGFAIDSNGQITIADASVLDLDYEDGALVATLTVEVTDGTTPAQQIVTVNVSPLNDNTPIFTAGGSQTFTIVENSGNGTVIGSAAATDADVPADSLSYAIVAGDSNNGFTIDSNGQITIADASVLDLDYEDGPLVATLTVEVSDGTNTAQQAVTVNVSAVNDNIPIFTAGGAQTLTVAENSGDGTVVGSAAATDADVPAELLGYSIVGGDPNSGFAIDSNGQITIANASALDLDFENGASSRRSRSK